MLKKTTLSNGIRVLTEYMPDVRSVSVGIWVCSGSANEKKNQSGLAHFIEHMMFKGTKTRSAMQIAKTIEGVGGYLNAFTNRENTCYYVKVLDSNLPLALEVLIDILKNSLFLKQEINKERKVILEEIKMYEDSPEDKVNDLFLEKTLNAYAYSHNILGTKEKISNYKKEDLLKFYHENYVPKNMIVTAAGNLNHEKITKQIQQELGKLTSKKKVVLNAKPSYRKNFFIHQKDTEQIYFVLGTQGLEQANPYRYALAILDTVIGGGMSSRLFQEVREKKGYAYSIGTHSFSFRNTGLFCISASTSAVHLTKTISEVFKVFKKIKKENITNEELKRTKEQLKGALMLGLETPSARMFKIGRDEIFLERSISLDEILNEVNKVNKDTLNEVINIVLQKKYSFCGLGKFNDKIIAKVEKYFK